MIVTRLSVLAELVKRSAAEARAYSGHFIYDNVDDCVDTVNTELQAIQKATIGPEKCNLPNAK